MYPVKVSISRDLLDATADLNPAGIVDILWAHALPSEGLEHIGLCVTRHAVDAVLFIKSDAPENAYRAAVDICRRTLSASCALAGWKLTADDAADAFIKIT